MNRMYMRNLYDSTSWEWFGVQSYIVYYVFTRINPGENLMLLCAILIPYMLFSVASIRLCHWKFRLPDDLCAIWIRFLVWLQTISRMFCTNLSFVRKITVLYIVSNQNCEIYWL
jgi:hypothetical protein